MQENSCTPAVCAHLTLKAVDFPTRTGVIVPATSDADVLERASETRWDSILSGIRADGLDCLQSTVAVIADAAYGSGTHLALGSRWRFPVRGPDGIVRVQPSVAER